MRTMLCLLLANWARTLAGSCRAQLVVQQLAETLAGAWDVM